MFMLVSDAPIIFGRYVTRERIGFILKLNHSMDCMDSGDVALTMHIVATADIKGYWH